MEAPVETLKFTWKIQNFSNPQNVRLASDVFSLGPCKWRILAYPKGNKMDDLSIYLEVVNSETLPFGWSQKAKFSFTLIDQIDEKSSLRKETEHEFNAEHNNWSWGYASFVSQKELHDPEKGYLVGDACVIEADVAIYEGDFGESNCASRKGNCEEEFEKNSFEEDMDAFFGDLEFAVSAKKVVCLEEEKRALRMIEEALNMNPADLNKPGRMSRLKYAFDVLSSLDHCSELTSKKKEGLLSMNRNFLNLAERAATAVKVKMLFARKVFAKMTLERELGKCVIEYEKALAETEEHEKMIAFHQKQICAKKRKKRDSASNQTKILLRAKELKTELDELVKKWPVYEAKKNVAEEEEKAVGAEWSKMKRLFSSLKKPI